MTALVLGLVTRRGEDTAREYVFRHFRRQHLEKFLPGLQKLGLADQPPAPACALYHYHSNALGGVKTGYLRESDRKAWVRYPPPRWIWRGTAIAAVPHSVSAAMLHGWHGHNGVSLGKPNLGFVCTGMTVDGMPGLEGYYFEYDRPLKEDERVRFAYGTEEMPRVDWASQPRLETANWPEERRLRTFRAYAVEYLRTMLPTLQELLGADGALNELGRVARLVGLQFHEETARDMDLPTDVERGDAAKRARLRALAVGHPRGPGRRGRDARTGGGHAAAGAPCANCKLADPLKAFDAWNELWLGAAAAHDRFLKVQTTRVASASAAGRSAGGSHRDSPPAACSPAMASPSSASRQPARLEMFVAQHRVARPIRRQANGTMRTKRPGSTSNRCSSRAAPTSTSSPVSSRTSRRSAAR